MSSPQIIILPDRSSLAREAALRFVTIARDAIQSTGTFSVTLSGGSTPRDAYALLATPEFAAQIDWARVHVFWGDERAVPPDSPDSNYRMAQEALLAHVPMPAQNVHRIRAELTPEDAAKEYQEEIERFIASNGNKGNEGNKLPKFDLILLGLGANGHTASLFPHTHVLRETQRWVAAEYIDEVKMWRITLTAPIINAARNIVWLVSGADKAQTVHDVLRGEYRPDDLPAQLIKPTNGNMVWLVDQDAAARLSIGA